MRRFVIRRLESKRGLITRPRLLKEIKGSLGMDVTRHTLDKLLKLDLQVVWKRVRPQSGYVNSRKNIVLRQAFAKVLIETMMAGKKLINFDETCITSTYQNAYSYAYRAESNSRAFSRHVHGLSLLLAVSEDGLRLFEFIDGAHNSWTFLAFMVKMVHHLDEHVSNWRDQYVIVLDNCAAHTSVISARVLAHLRVPLLYTAPASYAALPVEGIFAMLKAVDLDAIADPPAEMLASFGVTRATGKNLIMYKLAVHLNRIPNLQVGQQYQRRLSHLERFLHL